jgi:hypothetical protein
MCGSHDVSIDCDRASAVAYRQQCVQAVGVTSTRPASPVNVSLEALDDIVPAAVDDGFAEPIVDDASLKLAVDDDSSSFAADDGRPALADLPPDFSDYSRHLSTGAIPANQDLKIPISDRPRTIKKSADGVQQSTSEARGRLGVNSDRLRALSARYGIDLSEPGWARHATKPAQRVMRSIRTRVCYFCHHCKTQYGSSNVCSECKHRRCRYCIRHPPRKATDSVGSWVASIPPNPPLYKPIAKPGDALTLEGPKDNDGPSGSQQSGVTAQVGSSTSLVSLQTPESVILREGSGSGYATGLRPYFADQRAAQYLDAVSMQALQPYILFCVPAAAVSPHGAYLSHLCRKRFTGHEFFTRLNAEFDRLHGSARWSKFWARFRVMGCHEIKLVRVSVP